VRHADTADGESGMAGSERKGRYLEYACLANQSLGRVRSNSW